MDDSVNIAAILRDIAINAEDYSGKIIAKCQKAAAKGKSSILIVVDDDEWDCVYYNRKLTPLLEKLRSLGFVVNSSLESTWFFSRRKIIIKW